MPFAFRTSLLTRALLSFVALLAHMMATGVQAQTFAYDLLWTGAQNSVWATNGTNWQQTTAGLNHTGSNIAFVQNDNAYFGSNATIAITNSGVHAGGVYVTNVTGTVAIGGGDLIADNITKTSAGNLTLSNSTISLIGTDALSTYGVLENKGSGTLTISGALTNGSVVNSGTGVTTLSDSNSYTGGTIVSSGTVAITTNTALGNGAVVVDASGTLTYTAAAGAGSKSSFQNSLTGTGFVNSFAGSSKTLTLGGANQDFSGTLNVGSGSVEVAGASALGSSSIQLQDTTSLNFNGIADTTFSNNISVASGLGAIINQSSSLLTLAGNLTKTGSILELAGGSFNVTGAITGNSGSFNSDLILSNAAVTLSGNNSFYGPVSVIAGSTLTSGVANAVPTTSVLTIGGAGDVASVTNSFNLNGNNQTLVSIADAGSGVNQILNNGSGANLSLTGNSTFRGQVNGSLNLSLSGSGTTSLTGTNGYTGTTTVNGGILNLGSTGKLASTPSVTITNGGFLMLGSNNQVNTNATLSLSGTLSMGANGSTRAAAQTFSTLTLTGNSVIDFANLGGTSTLTYGSISLNGFTLSIYDWNGNNVWGTTSTTGGSGQYTQLIDLGAFSGNINSISFYSGAGTGFLGNGVFSGNQIVPVPEPGVIVAAFMLLGLLIWSNRGTIASLVARRA